MSFEFVVIFLLESWKETQLVLLERAYSVLVRSIPREFCKSFFPIETFSTLFLTRNTFAGFPTIFIEKEAYINLTSPEYETIRSGSWSRSWWKVGAKWIHKRKRTRWGEEGFPDMLVFMVAENREKRTGGKLRILFASVWRGCDPGKEKQLCLPEHI